MGIKKAHTATTASRHLGMSDTSRYYSARICRSVANTAEIGAIIVSKIEKKSAMTRRVVLRFVAPGEAAG